MKRSGKTGGKTASWRRRKAVGRKRPAVAKLSPKPERAEAGGLQEQLDRKTRELNEALEQQNATAEVLRVISSSPGALQPVFQAMLQNATRICDAKIGICIRYEDGAFSALSHAWCVARLRGISRVGVRSGPAPATNLGRVARTKQPVHIMDTQAEQNLRQPRSFRVSQVPNSAASRSLLNVPMLKDG